jgi:hypothetical protein
MFGGRTGLPYSLGNKYSNLALQGGKVSRLRQKSRVMSPAGLRLLKDCACEAQLQI